jgi:hypothetical protein
VELKRRGNRGERHTVVRGGVNRVEITLYLLLLVDYVALKSV